MRRCKHNDSPPSADMHKRMPSVFSSSYIHIEVENFQKGIVGERCDSHLLVKWLCFAQISNCHRENLQGTAHLDHLWPANPVGDVQHSPFLSALHSA